MEICAYCGEPITIETRCRCGQTCFCGDPENCQEPQGDHCIDCCPGNVREDQQTFQDELTEELDEENYNEESEQL